VRELLAGSGLMGEFAENKLTSSYFHPHPSTNPAVGHLGTAVTPILKSDRGFEPIQTSAHFSTGSS
jgi:hypothetical protein